MQSNSLGKGSLHRMWTARGSGLALVNQIKRCGIYCELHSKNTSSALSNGQNEIQCEESGMRREDSSHCITQRCTRMLNTAWRRIPVPCTPVCVRRHFLPRFSQRFTNHSESSDRLLGRVLETYKNARFSSTGSSRVLAINVRKSASNSGILCIWKSLIVLYILQVAFWVLSSPYYDFIFKIPEPRAFKFSFRNNLDFRTSDFLELIVLSCSVV